MLILGNASTRLLFRCNRFHYSTLLKTKKKSLLSSKPVKDKHPTSPVRTRFAPSPTGFMHLGSLRTALYNYLLAKSTGGQFLLRLEDTDQKRLVEGAEEDIYETLKWCGIEYDEGPNVNSEAYGPFRQSERTKIYAKHIKVLLENGDAYKCFCTKERLDEMKESAQKLNPPSSASYDRHCLHLNEEEIKQKELLNSPYTIRLKSPEKYPEFEDLLHGKLSIQIQYNPHKKTYDDPILIKSDGLPTYHFANVVDDHLMKITHVIRGEEWLPSTPKHISMYNALGWQAPKYIHIPLLTSINDKKLSKRKGDSSILSMKKNGVLPEALLNFSVLFGWSPPRKLSEQNHECFTKEEFIKYFNLNYLTKGNAKVDDKKLWYFNKHYLKKRLEDNVTFQEIEKEILSSAQQEFTADIATPEKINHILKQCGSSLTSVNEFNKKFYYFFKTPEYTEDEANIAAFLTNQDKRTTLEVLTAVKDDQITTENLNEKVSNLAEKLNLPIKKVFQSLRFALAGSHPGAKLPILIGIIGPKQTMERIDNAIVFLKQVQDDTPIGKKHGAQCL
ncbi:hypothetical protein TPHA_0L00590 [Tetrapisispora phaffii CBS 4417]|uniref:Glutamate--tRNA ligase, mitochondrial n=1 Tax=Tetrapisispora phaffii (strain ATCC 24235 / CBS 4417 / NBRC 1672 / NRRL Y-8282 / UCD 70-5) TaxID=1071381 RepID=G8BZT7_TETPH|nr:hypothetical protein TPHA_0L00590 [Tetrapisispora phaffii CBS 4417]CCE65415.1 hypothetical protein TPHA_0L00590 [Tetrapisispora phaffii CBS 4417]